MKKHSIFLIGFILLLAGCPRISEDSILTKQYTVKFEAGDGGTLTAKTKDGNPIANGDRVYERTEIIFTAIPNDGSKVEKWEGDGLPASAGKKIVTLTVTDNADVKVTFTAAKQCMITFNAEPPTGGTITAKRKDNGASVTSGSKVDEEREIIFTATPSADDKGYYILGWSGEGLKISSDKTTAELTVKKDTDVKVQFQKYLIQNANWEAAGMLKTKDGKMKKFHMVINDGGKYFSFFDNSPGGRPYVADMTYDKSAKTVTLQKPLGEGTIRFVSMKDFTPSDWTIQLENVKVGTLELDKQTATINVTFNKDNFIH